MDFMRNKNVKARASNGLRIGSNYVFCEHHDEPIMFHKHNQLLLLKWSLLLLDSSTLHIDL
jgi:hypothetical protein